MDVRNIEGATFRCRSTKLGTPGRSVRFIENVGADLSFSRCRISFMFIFSINFLFYFGVPHSFAFSCYLTLFNRNSLGLTDWITILFSNSQLIPFVPLSARVWRPVRAIQHCQQSPVTETENYFKVCTSLIELENFFLSVGSDEMSFHSLWWWWLHSYSTKTELHW